VIEPGPINWFAAFIIVVTYNIFFSYVILIIIIPFKAYKFQLK